MFMVYWSETEHGHRKPHAKEFAATDMVGAMKLMEELRAKQRAGGTISFVTMAAENPDSVGHPGVAEPGPGYHWKKRRR